MWANELYLLGMKRSVIVIYILALASLAVWSFAAFSDPELLRMWPKNSNRTFSEADEGCAK